MILRTIRSMENVLVTIYSKRKLGEELLRQDSRGYLANTILVAYTLSYLIFCTTAVHDIMYKHYSLTQLLGCDKPRKVLRVVKAGSRKSDCNSNSVEDRSLNAFGVR